MITGLRAGLIVLPWRRVRAGVRAGDHRRKASTPTSGRPVTDRTLTRPWYRMLDSGCDGSLRWALRWRDVRAPRLRGLVGGLQARGGFCDCEIFLNGWEPARVVGAGECVLYVLYLLGSPGWSISSLWNPQIPIAGKEIRGISTSSARQTKQTHERV